MILSVTGHRPDKLGGYSLDVYNTIKRTATLAFTELQPERIIVGMALGWDMACADAAIDLGIPFTAAIPFKTQASAWPADSRLKYRNLLRSAADIVIVSDGEYAPWKMHKRNEWMVDLSDTTVALWNEKDFTGGTAACMKYAFKKQRVVLNAWSIYQALQLQDMVEVDEKTLQLTQVLPEMFEPVPQVV